MRTQDRIAKDSLVSSSCQYFLHTRSIPSLLDARDITFMPEDATLTAGSSPADPLISLAHTVLLDHFGLAAVVIDRQNTVLKTLGETRRFLTQARGEPMTDLLELAQDHVKAPLASALQKVAAEDVPVKVVAPFIRHSENETLEISIVPLGDTSPAAPHLLVAFRELASPSAKLNLEIDALRAEMKSSIGELQVSNGEYRASNEEALYLNEELRTANEEMEANREELQVLNEKLTSVNTDLHLKMEQLEATSNDLSGLLASTNIAVVFLDTHLKIRRYTPAVGDLFDLIPSDIGRPLSDLSRKFEDDTLLPGCEMVLHTLGQLEKEVVSESRHTYIRRILPSRTTDDRIDGVVVTFIDISQLKAVEAAMREGEHLHRLVLEGIKDYAIFMLDPEGRIETWNAAAQSVLGYKAEEALGQLVTLLLPPEDRDRVAATANFDRAIAEGSVMEENWYASKDGHLFWGSGVISAVKDDQGAIHGFVKVVRDNTDRKRADEALELAKRSAELSNDAKDNFLANVSHELRTPLSAILLWSRHLESSNPPSPEELHEGIRSIRSSAEQQSELIEDLMDTARIVAGELRLNRQPVSLMEVLDSSVKSMAHLAAQKEVTLVQDLDKKIGRVHLDQHRLHQVISNLLNNALRHTPPGKTVSLAARRIKNEVQITVTDEGHGISADFLPRVFERFDRADRSSVRGKSGLGLGLFIARQLVALHGGKITAHSDGPGTGAVFKISMPLPAIVGRKPGKRLGASASQKMLKGIHILLVEDAPETRAALSVILRNEKAEVTDADSAEAALSLLKDGRFDIIVSDIGLPDMDGYEFIQRACALAAKQPGRRPGTVALTAYTGVSDRERAMASGFDQWLPKPVHPDILACAIAELHRKPRS